MLVDIELCLAFVRQAYVEGYMNEDVKQRTDFEPNWYHSARVAQTLNFWLEELNEGTESERRDIVLGAVGHDLLEDVKVTEEQVRALFGDRPLQYIRGMTRKGEDFNLKDYAAYTNKLVGSREEIRMIKLADLIDNYTAPAFRVAYGPINDSKKQIGFFENTLMPILDMQKGGVLKTDFKHYPITASHLCSQVRYSRHMLTEEIGKRKNEMYQFSNKID